MPIRTLGKRGKPVQSRKESYGKKQDKKHTGKDRKKEVAPSSRVFVSNLPKHLKENRLKEVFSKAGEVTDAKIMKSKAGDSRKFGFVGFRTIDEAQRAKQMFEKSFIDTSRISVQFAAPYAESSQPKPRSNQTNLKENSVKSVGQKETVEEKEDSEFREFLSVALPGASQDTRKFWSNDDTTAGVDDAKEDEDVVLHKSNVAFDDDSDGDESDEALYDEESGSKLIGEDSDNDSAEDDDDDESNQIKHRNDLDDFIREVVDETDEEKDDEIGKEECEQTPNDISNDVQPTKDKVDLAEVGRLFVRNLPFTATEEDLTKYFERFGTISELRIPLDDIKRSKGYAFIQYKFPENAVAALSALDGKIFLGRLLHILPAEPAPHSEENAETDDSFKSRKQEQLSKLSQKSDIWNTLHVRNDSAVGAVARSLGVEKGEIMDPHSDMAVSLPVRVALAETQVIAETKSFLEENGVSLQALEGVKERSKTVILVKNLPASTEAIELRRVFGKFGTLGRFVLSPSAVLCIVEFLEQSQAQKAFKALAYKKFKHAPLYLEWAPSNVFRSSLQEEVTIPTSNPSTELEQETLREEGGSTLFVKNLNFDTVEETLERVFNSVGAVRKVTVVRRKHDKSSVLLSMGYGFVEFADAEGAMKALKTMQRVQVDGHFLDLRVSRTVSEDLGESKKKRKSSKSKSATKIIVKNLPFQANARELKALFGTFGQIKTCRIPKKIGGNHRGFAFIEFVSQNEAKNALNALQSTHFYGRHLVLEWANEDENIDDVREKTIKLYHGDGQ